jgi:hypothetical protein
MVYNTMDMFTYSGEEIERERERETYSVGSVRKS